MYGPYEFERYIAAGDPCAPYVVLKILSVDASVQVRIHVAENESLRIELLADMAADECSDVRLAIAENPVTPHYILELLAQDGNPDVRLGIAANANIPEDILRQLEHDENPYVAARARTTLSALTRKSSIILSERQTLAS